MLCLICCCDYVVVSMTMENKAREGKRNECRENLVVRRIKTSRHSLCEANHVIESYRLQGEHQFTFH